MRTVDADPETKQVYRQWLLHIKHRHPRIYLQNRPVIDDLLNGA